MKNKTKYFWMLVAGVVLGSSLLVGLVAFDNKVDGATFVVLSDFVVGLVLMRGLRSKLKSYMSWKHLKIILFNIIIIAVLDYLVIAFAAEAGAAKTGILSLLKPGIIYLLALSFLREAFSLRVFTGTIISFIGAGLILVLPAISDVNSIQFADFAVAIGFILSGVMAVVSKLQFKYFEPTHLVGLRSFFAAFLLAPIAYIQNGTQELFSLSLMDWTLLILLLVICGALGAAFQFKALQKVRAEDTVGVFLLGPTVGVLGGVLLLSEQLDPLTTAGSAIVLFGILISHDAHHKLLVKFHKDEERLVRFVKRVIHKIALLENRLLS